MTSLSKWVIAYLPVYFMLHKLSSCNSHMDNKIFNLLKAIKVIVIKGGPIKYDYLLMVITVIILKVDIV